MSTANSAAQNNNPDPRHISNGSIIPTVSYSDQPFIIKTDDGAWLCCVTTGSGHEGAAGQHVTTMRSTDYGKTWSAPVPVEPPSGPEASYAVMLKVPSGRIYIFYNHNTDNVREVKRHDHPEPLTRVDSLGHFVFKYSDDHGRTWSDKRYDVPFRLFECDRENIYQGKLCFFWNVGKPFTYKTSAYVSLHKVGKMGHSFFDQSEGALLKSSNILTETDPSVITWETLPDGDIGLRTPPGGGPIAEEQSYVVLSDGSFYVVYRTVDGYPAEAYSRDEGRTWTEPRYMSYADGRKIKNPRAANFVWKCMNGKYLYWFHNHGGHFIRNMWGIEAGTNGLAENCGSPYDDRNPAWLCGGIEADSPEGKIVVWSQPEIAVYDDDPFIRMSYPDFIEENGRYFITETNKQTARVHEFQAEFINNMWAGLELSRGIKTALARINPEPLIIISNTRTARAPLLPEFFVRNFTSPDYCGFVTRKGFTLGLSFSIEKSRANDLNLRQQQSLADYLIDGRRADGRGLSLCIVNKTSLELRLNDGQTDSIYTSENCLTGGRKNHVIIILDGGPRIVSFVVNGCFCDGGDEKQFGWQRINPLLRHVNWSNEWRIGSSAAVVENLSVYERALTAAEAVKIFTDYKL